MRVGLNLSMNKFNVCNVLIENVTIEGNPG